MTSQRTIFRVESFFFRIPPVRLRMPPFALRIPPIVVSIPPISLSIPPSNPEWHLRIPPTLPESHLVTQYPTSYELPSSSPTEKAEQNWQKNWIDRKTTNKTDGITAATQKQIRLLLFFADEITAVETWAFSDWRERLQHVGSQFTPLEIIIEQNICLQLT